MNFKLFTLLAVVLFASVVFGAESETNEPEIPQPETMGEFIESSSRIENIIEI